MRTWRINAYGVLAAGYLIGAATYVGGLVGVLAITAPAYGWPWLVIWTWVGLAHVARPCVVQLLPFALLAAAAFAARSLNRERIVTAAILLSTIAVVAVNVAVLGDWLVSEIAYANYLVDFHRDHPGAVVDRFDGGLPATAAYATAKTIAISLVLAVVCIMTAILVSFARWKGARAAQ